MVAWIQTGEGRVAREEFDLNRKVISLVFRSLGLALKPSGCNAWASKLYPLGDGSEPTWATQTELLWVTEMDPLDDHNGSLWGT